VSRYKFVPNQFATEKFNLAASEYTGDGMVSLMKEVMGLENFNKHMITQAPLDDGKTHNGAKSGAVFIALDKDNPDPGKRDFRVIGTIYALTQ